MLRIAPLFAAALLMTASLLTPHPALGQDPFCDTHACIPNFENGTGSIVQCNDGMWSHSGGQPGACSDHGGVKDSSSNSGGSTSAVTAGDVQRGSDYRDPDYFNQQPPDVYSGGTFPAAAPAFIQNVQGVQQQQTGFGAAPTNAPQLLTGVVIRPPSTGDGGLR
jgi:hypothetical protein